jgi:hypothetical protein
MVTGVSKASSNNLAYPFQYDFLKENTYYSVKRLTTNKLRTIQYFTNGQQSTDQVHEHSTFTLASKYHMYRCMHHPKGHHPRSFSLTLEHIILV